MPPKLPPSKNVLMPVEIDVLTDLAIVGVIQGVNTRRELIRLAIVRYIRDVKREATPAEWDAAAEKYHSKIAPYREAVRKTIVEAGERARLRKGAT